MGVAAMPRSGRWLFGPLPDLLLGCGLLYVILFVAHSIAAPTLVGLTPAYLFPLGTLLFSAPHYGGTLVRVYDQRRDRRAYAVFSIWATLALFGLFLATLGNPFLGSVLFTLYLTWSPWHYSGQNYGLAVMFLRRRKIEVTPVAKRWLYASFLLSFLLAAIVSHLEVGVAYSPLAYQGQKITFLPIGITRGFGDVVLPIVGAAYLTSLVASAYLLRRAAASWRDLIPSFVLVLTQALWFAAPFSVHYWSWKTGLAPLDAQDKIANYALMIFLAHGIQYLWITTYYARAGSAWHGYANYWAKAAAAGVAIWTLPLVVLTVGAPSQLDYDGSVFALVATFVNLHHFVLDGAIWKLRNTRIASVLIRSCPEQEGAEATLGSPWIRRVVWSIAGAGLVAAFVGFAAVQFYAPSALARGDLASADYGLNLGTSLGQGDELLRVRLVDALLDRGDTERAAELLDQLAVTHPYGDTYAELGRLEMKRGNADAARAAFETALEKNAPSRSSVHVSLARLALKRGDEAAAVQHYRSAIALRPRSTAIANDFAWLLATSSDPAVRDVKTSLAVAEQLVKVEEKPNHFDTLAAAYAAAGRYEDAIGAASRAAALAEQQRDAILLADIQRNLARYRASQPAIASSEPH